MSPTSPCPDGDVLRRLVLGQLPEDEARPLEEHLARCDRCALALQGLGAEDSLVKELQDARAAALPGGTVIDALVQRLSALQPPTESQANTPSGAPGQESLPPDADAGPESWAFLAPAEGPGELGRLGPYRVLRVFGAGGMGVVFEAEDPQLRRPVALKVLRPALATSASARARFLREAQAAAAVAHDHIVPVHQVGEDRGIPYLAMPLLRGESLEQRLRRQRRLPVAEVVRIGREAAEGLAAAHERGLVHRDVKPSNLWLEARCGETEAPATGAATGGRVRLLDFGLARAAAEGGGLTESRVIVGTPAYMAPEQARAGAVDQRADLFGLGCVLYRMATGEVPFKGSDSLSTLAALASDQPRPPRQLNPAVPPALSALILRLLAKDPARRPASAAEVVAALDAVARDPDGGAGRPAPAPGPEEAFGRLKPGDPCPADARQREQIPADELAAAGGGDAAKAPPELVAVFGDSRLRHGGWCGHLAFSPDGTRLASASNEHTVVVWDTATGRARRTFDVEWDPHARGAHQWLAFSKDGRTLLAGGTPVVRRWDVATGRELSGLRGHAAPVYALAVSPDGRTIATGSDREVRLWDAAAGRERLALPAPDAVTHLHFSADGKTLFTGSEDDATLRRWDVATGQAHPPKGVTKGGPVYHFALSPDGRTLAVAHDPAGSVRLWDAATGREQGVLGEHGPDVRAVAFSPDGTLLASGGWGGDLRLWDLAAGRERQALRGHTRSLLSVAFSPDGRALASADDGGVVKLWDPATGEERVRTTGAAGNILGVAFSPDGQTLAWACGDHTVRLGDVATGQEGPPLRGHRFFVSAVAFSPDGRMLASASYDGTVRLWDRATGAVRHTLQGHGDWVYCLAWSPTGRRLASGGREGTVRLWDPATGQPVLPFPAPRTAPVLSVAFSPDGQTVAAGAADGKVQLWDALSGREVATREGVLAAFGADGQVLATAADDRVLLWDLAAKGGPRSRQRAAGKVTSLAFSPDGSVLAASCGAGMVHLWDVAGAAVRGQRALAPGPFARPVSGLAFSPEGRHLATANGNGTVCVFRLAPSAGPASPRR
jgi:WD40 repeat protein